MQPLVLPPLPYDFGALEPVISAEIMKLHYTKHHQAYVNNFNAALARLEEAQAKNDLNGMLSLQAALRFNGGGDLNHSIFWQNLAPVGEGGEPSAELLRAMEQAFGSFDRTKELMTNAAVAIQGSGWAWLGYDPIARRLTLTTCSNQDPLQATTGQIPLLGFDVWEHAYYLQYKNVRADYVKALWQIVNWKDLQARWLAASRAP